MTTLYKRATGPQQRMLKIVSGAVLNTAHAHGASIDRKFARGVAKRAVGTLSANWADMLAARATAPSGLAGTIFSASENGAQLDKRREGTPKQRRRPLGLILFNREVSSLIGAAKIAGQHDRAQALIDCMRIMDRIARQAQA